MHTSSFYCIAQYLLLNYTMKLKKNDSLTTSCAIFKNFSAGIDLFSLHILIIFNYYIYIYIYLYIYQLKHMCKGKTII